MAAGVQDGTSLVGSEGPGAATLITQGNAEAASAAGCGAGASEAAGDGIGAAEPTCRECQKLQAAAICELIKCLHPSAAGYHSLKLGSKHHDETVRACVF